MGDGYKQKEYTLTDGSVWTARSLAKKLNMSSPACRQRLLASDDPKYVMRTVAEAKRKRYKCKRYTLSDGTTADPNEIAKRFDICPSTMYARLGRGERDIAILSRQPTQGRHPEYKGGFVRRKKPPKEVSALIETRNFYDPMSRLFLMTA
jgi:hypothetical protein